MVGALYAEQNEYYYNKCEANKAMKSPLSRSCHLLCYNTPLSSHRVPPQPRSHSHAVWLATQRPWP